VRHNRATSEENDMKKKVVAIQQSGNGRRWQNFNTACYHSYIPASHRLWLRKIDRLEEKRANKQKRLEAKQIFLEQQQRAKQVWEERQRKHEEELERQLTIVTDVLQGLREPDGMIYGYTVDLLHAGKICREKYRSARELVRIHAERKEEWKKFQEQAEPYEFWDFDHPPRK
jgi:hypothetical protein